ncbi:MAG: sugar transferase [Erythrobacter sp.]|nr:sugar transferase [Erythrobacter sp.]
MDQVLVSSSRADRLAWANILKGSGVQGELIDETSRDVGALGVIHHDDVNQSALLVSAGRLGLRSRALKRVFDIAVAGLALLLLSPLMVLVALAIRLQDGGPVFFRQRRMGRGNHFFDIYKFRSMRVAASDAAGNVSASRDDDRVTPVGRFIRRTSIDELPQLINVLKGDMSCRRWTIRSGMKRCCAWPEFWW